MKYIIQDGLEFKLILMSELCMKASLFKGDKHSAIKNLNIFVYIFDVH
jgi:hypothetical protein